MSAACLITMWNRKDGLLICAVNIGCTVSLIAEGVGSGKCTSPLVQKRKERKLKAMEPQPVHHGTQFGGLEGKERGVDLIRFPATLTPLGRSGST